MTDPAAVTARAAVLFDRDGTLVQDVPYNGDPGAVRVVDGAPAAVARVGRPGWPPGWSPTSPASPEDCCAAPRWTP